MVSQQQTPCFFQREFKLEQYSHGCHLVTDQIISNVPEIKEVDIGIFHLFLKHSSASLSLNENFDPDVRYDMDKILDRIVPEDNTLYKHTTEGKDDMPSHAKSSIIGCQLSIPITSGKLNLGTWQGIWLNEHREGKFSRNLVATIQGCLLKSEKKI